MTEKIPYTCEWCGKTKLIYRSEANGTTFQACSVECRRNLQSVYHKKWWANLTPEERVSVTQHAGNPKGLIEYHRKRRPLKIKKILELMQTPVEGTKPHERNLGRGEKYNPRLHKQGSSHVFGTCAVISAHHELLKDDPERLSTEFMQKICKVNCKCKKDKEETKDE